MTLLVDRDLSTLITAVPPLVSDTLADVGRWNTKIQPASLDLTVGRILVPIEDENVNQPLQAQQTLSLKQGETAVVETLEVLELPPTLAAIGFPPSSVSLEGLLMTNPGHVDPGFRGRLKFTVINMAKQPYELHAGKIICTLLFFRIAAPNVAYRQLDTAGKPPLPPDQDTRDKMLLVKLSKDFMNFTRRIRDQVAAQLLTAQIWTPIITAVAAVALTLFTGYITGIMDLRVKVEGLEKSLAAQDLKGRVERLENQSVKDVIQEIKARLEKLENQPVPKQ